MLCSRYADTSGAANDVYEFVRISESPHSHDLYINWECLICVLFVQVKSIGRFKETKRTDGISTSDIIMRILKDYSHIMRNLTRGYSRKDLGVSYVKVPVNSIASITSQKDKEQKQALPFYCNNVIRRSNCE